MFRLVSLIIGYLFGCFQTSYILAKYFYKIDIRDYGSKNAGATNVLRVLGRKMGITVFVFDILKAVLSYLLCSYIFSGGGSFYNSGATVLPGLYAGIGTILGHNFPFYLKFSGGKGSSSGLGLIMSLDLVVMLFSFVAGILAVVLTRYISLASMIVTFFFVIGLIFKYDFEVVCIAMFMLLLSIYRHRTNIKRILAGNENKFSFKSKGSLEK